VDQRIVQQLKDGLAEYIPSAGSEAMQSVRSLNRIEEDKALTELAHNFFGADEKNVFSGSEIKEALRRFQEQEKVDSITNLAALIVQKISSDQKGNNGNIADPADYFILSFINKAIESNNNDFLEALLSIRTARFSFVSKRNKGFQDELDSTFLKMNPDESGLMDVCRLMFDMHPKMKEIAAMNSLVQYHMDDKFYLN
jgi:hypothetical protein